MKKIEQIKQEEQIISAEFTGLCAWSDTRGVFKVTFGSGYVAEWGGMPLVATQAEKDKFIAQAAYNNHAQIHADCGHDLCEECYNKIAAAIQSPNFLYARCRSYGTTIYHSDPYSPTGVKSCCGMPNSVADQLLRKFGRTSSLSPTEDLRTAH